LEETLDEGKKRGGVYEDHGKSIKPVIMKLSAINDSAATIIMSELYSNLAEIKLAYNGNATESSNSAPCTKKSNQPLQRLFIQLALCRWSCFINVPSELGR